MAQESKSGPLLLLGWSILCTPPMKRDRKQEGVVEESVRPKKHRLIPHDGEKKLKSIPIEEENKSKDVDRPKKSKQNKDGDDSDHSTVASSTVDLTEIRNFRVSKESLSVLSKKGISTFFPIQVQTFDAIYDRKHVIGRARTGTGKTLAFALPSIESLIQEKSFTKGGVRHNQCRMLVLLPTRELAQQVAVEVESLECGGRFKTSVIVGGLPEDPQLRSLRLGGNVVIGTPGRTLDFLNRNLLDLQKVKVVVLDEADQMLEMGFRDDVDSILAHIFDKEDKNQDLGVAAQVLLFTATLPTWVNSVSNRYMTGREKVVVDVVKGQTNQTATGIKHLGIVCGFHQRARALGDLLQLYGGPTDRCIVFTETKAMANQIAMDSGISQICQVLHGDIQQKQREITLKAFKDGRFRCLVATDVAARGLHVDDIGLVIQMEPPKDIDTFVHRSGRTGRAGTTGTSIVFFGVQDYPFLMSIEKSSGIKFKRVGVPQPDELIKSTAERIVKSIVAKKNVGSSLEKVRPIAEEILKQFGATEAISRLLCELCGSKKGEAVVMSTLTGREGFKTYEVVFHHAQINHKGYVWKALKNALGDQAELTDKVHSFRDYLII